MFTWIRCFILPGLEVHHPPYLICLIREARAEDISTTMTNPNINSLQSTTSQALEQVRNNENGQPPANALMALERALAALWSRILADPDRYVMNREEFAIFNFHRSRYEASEVARRAVARYWNNPHGGTARTNPY